MPETIDIEDRDVETRPELPILISKIDALIHRSGLIGYALKQWGVPDRLRELLRVQHYTSTNCQHADHASCQDQCPYCERPCRCSCHGQPLAGRPHGRERSRR